MAEKIPAIIMKRLKKTDSASQELVLLRSLRTLKQKYQSYCYALLFATISKINGVKINSIAIPILPPGTTIVLGRDIKES